MTQTWPYDLAQVEIDEHELDDGDNVRRTQFADGFINQKRLATKALKIRRFSVAVAIDDVAAFRAWIEEHGNSWFSFVDPEDRVSRLCRVQGAKIPLRRVPDLLLPGNRKFYRGLVVLESLS